jgi:hypothetical protein
MLLGPSPDREIRLSTSDSEGKTGIAKLSQKFEASSDLPGSMKRRAIA